MSAKEDLLESMSAPAAADLAAPPSGIGSGLLSVAEHHPLAADAMREIDRVMAEGHACVAAASGGKDSGALTSMVLSVARMRKEAGLPVPPILINHNDTGVEQPEVHMLATSELAKMRSYAQAHSIPLDIRIGHPTLYDSWAVRIIGGRGLPTFPTGSGDCSVDLKVRPGLRLLKEAFAELRKDTSRPQPVLMTGVRSEESTKRATNIAKRGESATAVTVGDDGTLRLAPIKEWTADDVFEYLGYSSAGLIDSYSDFEDLMRFYRDAGGSSCAVVGDMRMTEAAARKGGGCGSRSGCWACCRTGSSDRSAETMIESDGIRYGYLRGLNRLRDFLSNTQYDWDSRNYLGRTIDADGYVAVQADVYSPSMLEKLLRYVLTAQVREEEAARRLGIKPRFTILSHRDIVAIDVMWSLYAIHPPHHALFVLKEVQSGKLLDAPITSPVPRSPVPRYGKVYVGRAWESDLSTGDPVRDRMLDTGIRSPVHEMFSDSCGFDVKETSTGLVTAWDTSDGFDVDAEGAMDFIEFFGDEMIEKYHRDGVDRTVAVRNYLSYGTVTMAHSSLARWSSLARRSQWMQRHGLVGEVQREHLIAMIEEQRAAGAALGPEALGDDEEVSTDLDDASPAPVVLSLASPQSDLFAENAPPTADDEAEDPETERMRG